MRRLSLSLCALLACLAVARSAAVSDEPPLSEADQKKQAAEMQKKMEEAARLGPHHKDLEYLLGTWDGVIEVVMPGTPPMPSSKVVGTGAWVIDGRWMGLRLKGTMMGRGFEGFGMFGFDNVRKAHVSSFVSNLDTALTCVSGSVVDPSGKIKSMYGTIDEYLTGEFDKPVRFTTKQLSPDQFVLEIADLAIGETGAVVLRETFTRRKS